MKNRHIKSAIYTLTGSVLSLLVTVAFGLDNIAQTVGNRCLQTAIYQLEDQTGYSRTLYSESPNQVGGDRATLSLWLFPEGSTRGVTQLVDGIDDASDEHIVAANIGRHCGCVSEFTLVGVLMSGNAVVRDSGDIDHIEQLYYGLALCHQKVAYSAGTATFVNNGHTYTCSTTMNPVANNTIYFAGFQPASALINTKILGETEAQAVCDIAANAAL